MLEKVMVERLACLRHILDALESNLGRKTGLSKILWYIDPLLDNDRKTNNEKTPAAMKQIPNKQQSNSNRGTVFSVRSVPICYNQDN
jgi:hypothetical protein